MIKTEIKEFKLNTESHDVIPCTLPASVWGTVHAAGLLPDPLFADNARAYSKYSSAENVFVSEFEFNQLSCSMEHNLLSLHRIDTPATVVLNGAVIAELNGDETDVLVNVKNNLRAGKNVLSLKLAPENTDGDPKNGRISSLSVGSCKILAYNGDMISCVHTRREVLDGFVRLHVSLDTRDNNGSIRAVATLVSPGGRVFYCGLMNNYGYIDVTDPNFWWPCGLGVQNLYKLTVNLYLEDEIVDSRDLKIGLVRYEKEERDLTSIPPLFVNGVRLYSRGACYLSDDALLPMLNERHTRSLLKSARDAGFNTVVVRDMSFYPERHFFDICDELGLVAWVEISCPPDDISRRARIVDQVLTSAYHTSLGAVIVTKEGRELLAQALSASVTEKLVITLEDLDVELLQTGASLPSPLTVLSYVKGRDANIFSPKMEYHSTLSDNKDLISSHMYRYPSGIADISYVTQMGEGRLLAEKIDKVQRSRGDALHTILPRLSDPWGQISESVVDSRGKWKAQQYILRDRFSPVRVGAVNEGTRVTFFVSNDQRSEYNGRLSYSVCDSSCHEIFRDGFAINVPANSSVDIMTSDFYEKVSENIDQYFVKYSITEGAVTTSKGVLLFTVPKDFGFLEPEITAEITGNGTDFIISITADVFVSGLEISFRDTDATFEDNYIDITDKTPVVIKFKTDKASAAPVLRRQLVLRSAYDIGRDQY